VKNLTETRDVSFASLNYISLRHHREFFMRADPKAGDVLVTKNGTLGVARIVRQTNPEFSIFVSVALLRPVASRLSPLILANFFESEHYERQMDGLSGGSGLKHIHLEQFRRFQIPLPPIREQERIGARLESLDEGLSIETVALAKLYTLKSGLMDDLLTGRVRLTPLLDAAAPA